MTEALAALERAVSDVGYWRWWTKTDKVFQVEFAWVMLYLPFDDASQPPSNTVALCFSDPRCVLALRRTTEDAEPPDDWFAKLGRDELQPLRVCDEEFTLTNAEQFRLACTCADQREFIIGVEQDLEGIGKDDAFLAFWAGNVGLAVIGEEMQVLSHRGRIAIEDVATKNAEWWEYWRRYWEQRDSDHPLPEDPLCEVTIPAGTDVSDHDES